MRQKQGCSRNRDQGSGKGRERGRRIPEPSGRGERWTSSADKREIRGSLSSPREFVEANRRKEEDMMRGEASFLRELVVALTLTPPWRIRVRSRRRQWKEGRWICWILGLWARLGRLLQVRLRDNTQAYVHVANNNITRVLLVRWRVMNGPSGCLEANPKLNCFSCFSIKTK